VTCVVLEVPVQKFRQCDFRLPAEEH
jgi:hypothetical protein